MATGAELTYTTSASALQMANTIFGDGVTVVSASYSGPTASKAVYSNGQLSPGVVPSTTGVILSTGNVASFTQSSGDPNRSTGTSTDTSGTNNNAAFNAIAGAQTYDAVWLDTTFIPTGNVMTMQFVIASEEYPEYVNSNYNDVVGVWINGVNVPISVGTGVSGVTNINGSTQPNLFVSNVNDTYNTEMDGFTVTLSLTIPVNSGVQNTIRIGVADTADAQYDTNLLIAADSVQTRVVAADDAVTLQPGETEIVDVLANDIHPGNATLVITHINGIPVVAGQTITLPTGQQITLNANGTFTIVGDGQTETVSFTYQIGLNGGGGPSDTGMVTITQVPCFVAGTLIETPQGLAPVESLRPGDLVMTQDDGPQPLRWSGQRRVAATGALAPVLIRAGTFGEHGNLLVSPLHRIVVRDGLNELLFGEPEVLIAARDLVNGRSVVVREGGYVDYVHLMFDRHQVVFAEGLATESFLPGPQMNTLFERQALDEICSIFPELDPESGQGYSPAARRMLKGFEAQVWRAGAGLAA